MPALSDPKMEVFAQALLVNIANDMPRTKAAHDAALKAGYRGSSLGSNARKRAQRKDVKARMAELAAPALAVVEQEVTASVEWATKRLIAIASPDLGADAIKVADQNTAIRTLAQIHGWMAPEQHKVTLQHEDALAQLDDDDDAPGTENPPDTA